jgi:hypothetical protein
MAKPGGYIPKVADVVMAKGVITRLVVVGVDTVKKMATAATTTIPVVSYTVPWSELSRLHESQDTARIVRESAES